MNRSPVGSSAFAASPSVPTRSPISLPNTPTPASPLSLRSLSSSGTPRNSHEPNRMAFCASPMQASISSTRSEVSPSDLPDAHFLGDMPPWRHVSPSQSLSHVSPDHGTGLAVADHPSVPSVFSEDRGNEE